MWKDWILDLSADWTDKGKLYSTARGIHFSYVLAAPETAITVENMSEDIKL